MKIKTSQKGFTLIELLVSIGIFVLMTALLLSRYSNFNQDAILTNAAYDLALTIREAQTYGLNVRSAPGASTNYSNEFKYAYGVSLQRSPSHFTLFVDSDNGGGNYYYDGSQSDEMIRRTTFKRGIIISELKVCNTLPCINNISPVNISFLRPNPEAIILFGGNTYNYVQIVLRKPNGDERSIIVNKVGQITVE